MVEEIIVFFTYIMLQDRGILMILGETEGILMILGETEGILMILGAIFHHG